MITSPRVRGEVGEIERSEVEPGEEALPIAAPSPLCIADAPPHRICFAQ